MDTHNIDICPIEWYGYALKSVRDISRICEEEMRESNHMRDITHLYLYHLGKDLGWDWIWASYLIKYAHNGWSYDLGIFGIPEVNFPARA